MSTVELKLGDMFDGPCDLIVIPCSTVGTITPFVQEKLVHYRIPRPKRGMRLGEVEILPFEGGENIAQFVAYAASVQGGFPTPEEAIKRIGIRLGEETTKTGAIHRISAPLLGAGAGHLLSELVVLNLRDGFKSSCHKDAGLTIYTIRADVFERVKMNLPELDTTGSKPALQIFEQPIRVFVSYSHSSPEHEQWVAQLATFLRENGIDTR